MFRSTKRKKKEGIRRSVIEDINNDAKQEDDKEEEEEDDVHGIMMASAIAKKQYQQKKKKNRFGKQKRNIVRSFSHEDDNDDDANFDNNNDNNDKDSDNEDNNSCHSDRRRMKSKKKKKKKDKKRHDSSHRPKKRKHGQYSSSKTGGSGMGYGGSSNLELDDYNDDDGDNIEKQQEDNKSRYGQDELNKLKLEQKYKEPAEKDSTNSHENEQNANKPKSMQPEQKNISALLEPKISDDNSFLEQDYVSLVSDKNTKKKKHGNNDQQDVTILTGEEALNLEKNDGREDGGRREEQYFTTVQEETTDLFNTNEAEESSMWEDRILRRAGLVDNNTKEHGKQQVRVTNRFSASSKTSNYPIKASGENASIAKLREQINSTMAQLQTQQSDIDHAYQRRQSEIKQVQEDLERQEKEVEESGTAFEYYQDLRFQITCCVGALRDLQKRVVPIQEAWMEWQKSVNDGCERKYREWMDCACSLLFQEGYVEKFLGHQPSPSLLEFDHHILTVDEFGRDVLSQQSIRRNQILRRNLKIKQQRKKRGRRQRQTLTTTEEGHLSRPACNNHNCDVDDDYDSDAFLSDSEINTLGQRCIALGKAMQMTLEEVEDEYMDVQMLADLFQKWKNTYPEDYTQCYAHLSLADLISALVQMDLCKNASTESFSIPEQEEHSLSSFSWLKLCNKKSVLGVNDFWLTILKHEVVDVKSSSGKDDEAGKEIVERVIEKAYIPILMQLLDGTSKADANSGENSSTTADTCYSVISTEQTIILSALCKGVNQLLAGTKSNPVLQKLKRRLTQYLQSYLQSITIIILKNNHHQQLPIPKNQEGGDTDEEEDEIECQRRDAYHYARVGQLLRISKIIKNILQYWIIPPEENGDSKDSQQVLLFEKGSSGVDNNSTESIRFDEFFLDFLSNKFLFLLSSLQEQSKGDTSNSSSETDGHQMSLPSTVFGEIFQLIKSNTNWLQDRNLILHTAPLRAAAIAYQCT